jgi:hypothetical protein
MSRPKGVKDSSKRLKRRTTDQTRKKMSEAMTARNKEREALYKIGLSIMKKHNLPSSGYLIDFLVRHEIL